MPKKKRPPGTENQGAAITLMTAKDNTPPRALQCVPLDGARRYLFTTEAVEREIAKDGLTKPKAFGVRYVVDAILRQRLGVSRIASKRSKPSHLHSRHLKAALGGEGYKFALTWLIGRGLLSTDNVYKVGESARGYAITKRGWRGGIVPVEMTDRQVERYAKARARLKRDSDAARIAEGVPLDYLRFHLGKLSFPAGAVEEHFERLPRVECWQDAARVEAHAYSVSLVRGRYWTFTRCRAGRLHYPLTNLPSALRRVLQYDGEDLVQIDVSSCQPFLASLLYDGAASALFSYRGVEEERARYLADLKGPSFYRGIAEAAVESITQEWREMERQYSRSLKQGCPVEEREEWREKMNQLHEKRVAVSAMLEQGGHKAIKKEVLKSVFFGGIAQMHESSIASGFGRLYPALYQRLASDKFHMAPEVPHRHPKRVGGSFGITFTHWRDEWKGDSELALLLQGAEAKIVIDGALARIAREKPGVPAFPIHDCLMTLERHADEVQRIMAEEFEAATGVVPAFKVEKKTQKTGT